MKILTAILLGNQQNKELSRVLDTDKSFTSKQIKELEDEGLVKREIDGREVKYEVDRFNLLKFLSTKVTIKWKKEGEEKN
jgi:predicted transcriptional regulator